MDATDISDNQIKNIEETSYSKDKERACIHDMKPLYNKEVYEIIKAAPALSKKVLYPNSLERQNVSL